jgi:cytochrome c-type biogenesis protein CcmH
MRALAAAILAALLTATSAFAVQPDEVLKDPVLERRARDISAGLRCLVCQNQSIDDSDAPLAKDLRVLVRDRLKAGETDREVEGYVVQRYGEFVLLRPVFGAHTLLLWLTPVLMLVLGGLAVYVSLWRRRTTRPAPLDESEKEALERLLRG